MQMENNWRLDRMPRERLEEVLWQAFSEVQRLRNREKRQADYQAMAAGLVLGAILATAGFAFGAYVGQLG